MENENKPATTNVSETASEEKKKISWGAIGAIAGVMAVIVTAIGISIVYESDEEKRFKELINLHENDSFRKAFREETDYWYRDEYREKLKKIRKCLATGKCFKELQELTLGCVSNDRELRQYFREILFFYNDVAIDINQKRVEEVEACEHFGMELQEFWRWYRDAIEEISKSEGNDYFINMKSAIARCEKLKEEKNFEYRATPVRFLNP